MATKLNYYKLAPSRSTQGYVGGEVSHMAETPTAKQKHFHSYLCMKCKENGINPLPIHGSRAQASKSIDMMIKLLREAGVTIKQTSKSAKPKYKFNTRTGEVIRIS